MKTLIKFNLCLMKNLFKLITINIIFMVAFLMISTFNKMINEDIFFKMTGSCLKLYSFLDISIFLIVNASIIYGTIYILNYDFKKSETFLRVHSLKKWILAKLCSLMIFDILFIFTIVIGFQIVFLILNQNLFNLTIYMVLILFIKTFFLQLTVIILFYIGGKIWK